jgi:glutamine synthetase
MLDYDKKFFLESLDNLTFDGSSVKGFSELHESDLRLKIDWLSLRFVPADVFGPGKVIVFANVCDLHGNLYETDFRGQLQKYAGELKDKKSLEIMMSPEVEGFLLEDVDAEQRYSSERGFKLVSSGGYFHSLPLDRLRLFIDKTAEVQRALGFQNEKDHPEVAPSQFEINFRYTDVVRACDQILLYKLIARQVADSFGLTATFLPKPIQGINGNGMHINFSLAQKGKNVFFAKSGREGLSSTAWDFVNKILHRAPDLCLLLNSSVNSYRRLDPNFEAPNQIKVSTRDRGSMIRLPLGNEKSARVEIRSVAPDANPYLALLGIVKTGLEDAAPKVDNTDKRSRLRYLPGTINDSIRIFKTSDYTSKLLGESGKQKYLSAKQEVANRNPRELGEKVKTAEVIYHHEVTNQQLWSDF